MTGLSLHRACRDVPVNHLGWVDVAGYDSEAYVGWYTNVGTMFSVNHRHSLMTVVFSPITVVGSFVAQRMGEETGKRAVIVVFGLVGAHKGAFTAFAFEVTDVLKADGPSELEVAVDNRWDETTQPLAADYSVCGGLYRGVRLIETDPVCIDPVTDGADGVAPEGAREGASEGLSRFGGSRVRLDRLGLHRRGRPRLLGRSPRLLRA